MNYLDAPEVSKDADRITGLRLLERAAEETGFSSDVINHAYTLALYHAGETRRLADASFQIGDSFVETDSAMAMDYFQRAFLGGLDAACVRHVGEIFERWAAPKRTRRVSRSARPLKKLAHVVGCLHKEHAPARHLGMLVNSLRQQGVESLVFTTEWAASWFFNPEGVLQSQPTDFAPDAVIASVEGSFSDRAHRIASAIKASRVKAVFYHAAFNEQITARVAAFRPASIQVNVAHGSDMAPALFDGYVHLTRQGLSSSRHTAEPAEWIPRASDIEQRLQACPPGMRQAMGLESAESVSATIGDLRGASDPAYLRVLSGLLKVFPQHFHLFAGKGEVKTIRAHLHAEGVLPRVRFLGTSSDVVSVLAATDLVLCPFVNPDESSLTEAMGAGKPPIVFAGPADAPKKALVETVGVPQLVAHTESEYTQIAQRLLRDSGERARHSELCLSRFRAEYDPSLLGPRYLDFLRGVFTS
jgi:hypothetical protein